jgi:hypothetical protein
MELFADKDTSYKKLKEEKFDVCTILGCFIVCMRIHGLSRNFYG